MRVRLARSSTAIALAMGLALSAFGCGGEDDDYRVPFGEGRDETPEPTPESETPTEDPEAPFEPTEGESMPAGTMNVRVEGAVVAEGAEVRALLPLDVDDDGDRDVVAVRFDPRTSTVGVWTGLRDRLRFTPRILGGTRVDEGCTVESARVATASPYSVIAEVTVTCEDEARSWKGTWVTSRERQPRLRETIAVRTPVEATVEVADLDEDHHEDLRVTFALGDVRVPIRWMDRPGGLSRDRSEPTATLQGLEEGRAPVVAALCGADAKVRIGSSRWGLSCPPELVQDAMRAGLDERLRAGELVAALRAIVAGGEASPEALDAAAAEGVTMRVWTEIEGVFDNSTARHTLLAIDGQDLVVRSTPALRVSATGARLPQETAPTPPVTDPGGALFVATVRRRCERHEAMLRPTPQPAQGSVPLLPRSVRILDGAFGCDERADDDEAWRVLGWAPMGLYTGWLAERRVVPLTATGEPAGQAVTQREGDIPPAPLTGARVTPGGETSIYETAVGVVRVDPDGVSLWRPEGWADNEAVPTAAAVSADGEVVAVLRERTVYRLSR